MIPDLHSHVGDALQLRIEVVQGTSIRTIQYNKCIGFVTSLVTNYLRSCQFSVDPSHTPRR
jgi:hypothetical protein